MFANFIYPIVLDILAEANNVDPAETAHVPKRAISS